MHYILPDYPGTIFINFIIVLFIQLKYRIKFSRLNLAVLVAPCSLQFYSNPIDTMIWIFKRLRNTLCNYESYVIEQYVGTTRKIWRKELQRNGISSQSYHNYGSDGIELIIDGISWCNFVSR